MNSNTILAVDLGGTNVRGALVSGNKLTSLISQRINPLGSKEEVTKQLFALTDKLINQSVKAIGIGVPGLIDTEKRIVYDIVNIPSWKEVALFSLMEERYNVPVLINNDANCFALGEFYFGKGSGSTSMIGLTIGTGLGSGIIINKKLYTGNNCGAGEFGMAAYLDQCYEYYASGQFFNNVYNIDGEVVFDNATKGDPEALRMYDEMGAHLGNAIKMMMYALDVELIVLGGSVRHAYPYFATAMWKSVETFAYKRSIERLRIEVSELENSGILGAAALHHELSHQL
jgi:glucokinase